VVARSGSRTAYGFGSDVALLDRFGWSTENGKLVRPGRELRPSVRGLFDLHGNLFEWTYDWTGDFGGSQTDPIGAQEGTYRVYRGGSYDQVASSSRAAYRNMLAPSVLTSNTGVRLAMSILPGVSSPAEQVQGQPAEPESVGTNGASAEQRPETP
jgi:formylglycine-generating enzyme required for sulfatase activity